MIDKSLTCTICKSDIYEKYVYKRKIVCLDCYCEYRVMISGKIPNKKLLEEAIMVKNLIATYEKWKIKPYENFNLGE